MIFKFEPLYLERVWGGRALETVLGRHLPSDANYGESWDLVDRADFQSIISSPSNKKITLRNLLESSSESVMGPGWDVDQNFPILVKWLDCSQRLSLQVHPPASCAKELHGEPKTENWFIAHSNPGAGLFIGLKNGVAKEEFLTAIETNHFESVCHWTESHVGGSVFVPSGRVHAIDQGNLILEIQQNSDTTYRVHDWGRKAENGKSRELHVEKSLKCIDFFDYEPQVIKEDDQETQLLADCDYFRIKRLNLYDQQPITLKKKDYQCNIINPIDVDIKIDDLLLPAGSLALSPYSSDCRLIPQGSGKVLVTDNFFIPD